MTQVTVEESVCAKLNGFHEPVELCDNSGRVFGRFVPVGYATKYTRLADQCPYTEAELEESLKEKSGRPLSEIWKSLGRSS